MTRADGPAESRVWARLGSTVRTVLERDLSPTDLQTLLLSTSRARADRVTPGRVMQRWAQDRFVAPAAADPWVLAPVVARLWSLVPAHFAGVELSPVAPLGTCAATAGVDQHRIVSTVRGTEVLSDPTNALAVEAAARRRAQPGRSGRVNLAACHRVLRAQFFSETDQHAHFLLFALVSTDRDRGSGRVEAEMLIDHLRYWRSVLGDLAPSAAPWLTFSIFDDHPIAERFGDTVRPAYMTGAGSAPLELDPQRRHGVGYYRPAALGLRAVAADGQEVDLGDGGFTDWTSLLLGDAKEKCLVSCISVERLSMIGR